MPFGRGMLGQWTLDPEVTYLNHGTVGAPPRRVLAFQQRIRDEMERQPARFMLRELVGLVGVPRDEPGRLRVAAAQVARFVGARGEDVVFVDNVTSGAMAVIRSLPLEPEDEIVITDHAYGAIGRVAAFVARERGAHVRTVAVPYPAFDPGRLVENVAAALGTRTRLVVVDHITAESALILPVAEIAARCREKDVPVLVDGAHAPGVLPLHVPSLGVDFYAANLHKWAHAPRSCGFLWAAPRWQALLHPPVISWGLGEGFVAEFDWVGTRDPSAWLSAPEGIAFLQDLNFPAVSAYCHGLACEAASELGARWGSPFVPASASTGFMVTLPLPEALGTTPTDAARLRDALLFEDHIEVQVHAGHGRLWARICAQVYNDQSDVARLGEAVDRRGRPRVSFDANPV
jgi:isopenicillin-N epimerase